MSLSRLIPNKTTRLLTLFYIVLIVWWITIFVRGLHNTPENYAFSLVYGLIPLILGLMSFLRVSKWGGVSSTIGRATLFLSIALICWGVGNLIFAFYNLILQVEVPYPSLADAGFILIYPFSAIGVFILSKATGASFAIKQRSKKIALIMIPIFLASVSYFLLFVVARGGVLVLDGGLLKLILDIAYPIGDAVVITFAIMVYWLSFDFLGGFFRTPIVVLLIGFVLAFITDFAFSYTTTNGTFFVGNWVDLLYTTTFFVTALGLTLLDPRLLSGRVTEPNRTSI